MNPPRHHPQGERLNVHAADLLIERRKFRNDTLRIAAIILRTQAPRNQITTSSINIKFQNQMAKSSK